MGSYNGYVNGVAFANHLIEFTKKLDESVIRMKVAEALSVGDLGGQLEGDKEDG